MLEMEMVAVALLAFSVGYYSGRHDEKHDNCLHRLSDWVPCLACVLVAIVLIAISVTTRVVGT